jgi:hypothetical protein
MLYRGISLALVVVLLHGSVAAQAQPQSPTQTVAKMQQVLHKAQGKDKAVKVTLNKKMDNPKQVYGQGERDFRYELHHLRPADRETNKAGLR